MVNKTPTRETKAKRQAELLSDCIRICDETDEEASILRNESNRLAVVTGGLKRINKLLDKALGIK
jgi:hypothetical protein